MTSGGRRAAVLDHGDGRDALGKIGRDGGDLHHEATDRTLGPRRDSAATTRRSRVQR